MGIRERKVEGYLIEQIESLGGICRDWKKSNKPGVPDQIVILNGVIIFVEVKTLDGELSDVQEREHKRLKRSGAIVCTIHGEGGVNDIIGKIKAGLPLS